MQGCRITAGALRLLMRENVLEPILLVVYLHPAFRPQPALLSLDPSGKFMQARGQGPNDFIGRYL